MLRKIERRKCECCGKSHRLLPDDQVPYKQYSAEVIEKVVTDDFTEDELLDYEDYPCESTKERWKEWSDRLIKNAEGQIRSVLHRIMDFSYEFLSAKDSLLEEIKKRIGREWLKAVLRMIINTGGRGSLPEPP